MVNAKLLKCRGEGSCEKRRNARQRQSVSGTPQESVFSLACFINESGTAAGM